jgi:hypothetical protein
MIVIDPSSQDDRENLDANWCRKLVKRTFTFDIIEKMLNTMKRANLPKGKDAKSQA